MVDGGGIADRAARAVLIADVPPLLDYPDHLAQLVMLAAGPDDRPGADIHAALGDHSQSRNRRDRSPAAAPAAGSHRRTLPAGRHPAAEPRRRARAPPRAVGRRSFWPLASELFAYYSGFLLGFLNWQIGSGLAMLFAAAWLTWREHHPVATIAAAAAASVVLFFCHLMGLVFFLVLIGSAEAHAMWRERRVLVRSASLLPVLIGPTVLWLLTALRDAPARHTG